MAYCPCGASFISGSSFFICNRIKKPKIPPNCAPKLTIRFRIGEFDSVIVNASMRTKKYIPIPIIFPIRSKHASIANNIANI